MIIAARTPNHVPHVPCDTRGGGRATAAGARAALAACRSCWWGCWPVLASGWLGGGGGALVAGVAASTSSSY